MCVFESVLSLKLGFYTYLQEQPFPPFYTELAHPLTRRIRHLVLYEIVTFSFKLSFKYEGIITLIMNIYYLWKLLNSVITIIILRALIGNIEKPDKIKLI